MNIPELFDGLVLGDNNPRLVAFVTGGVYDQNEVNAAAEKFVAYLNGNVSYGFVEALYYALGEVVERN